MQGKKHLQPGIYKMLRVVGTVLLLIGCFGTGYTMKRRLRENLTALYDIRQILRLLQNEITYSKASLPEACRRIAERTKEPYKSTFLSIYEEMSKNIGCSFTFVWKWKMEACLKQLPISAEDTKNCLSFGECVGFIDNHMQAQAIEHYMHNMDLSVKKLENDIGNKSKVIMSLSVMGGMVLAIILL